MKNKNQATSPQTPIFQTFPTPTFPELQKQNYRLSQNKQKILELLKYSAFLEVPKNQPNFQIKESSQIEKQNKNNFRFTKPLDKNKPQQTNSAKDICSQKNCQSGCNANRIVSNVLSIEISNTIQAQFKVGSEEIGKAIGFVCRGVILKKYCFGKLKVEQIVLSFSENFELMSVFLTEKGELKIYSMRGLLGIERGCKSERFEQFRVRGQALDETCSFSLIFSERSFDFRTESQQRREKIVDQIQLLWKCI